MTTPTAIGRRPLILGLFGLSEKGRAVCNDVGIVGRTRTDDDDDAPRHLAIQSSEERDEAPAKIKPESCKNQGQHTDNQTKEDWLYSVPFQRFQALCGQLSYPKITKNGSRRLQTEALRPSEGAFGAPSGSF